MQFLTQSDLKLVLKDRLINQIINEDQTILDKCEQIAISKISNFLVNRYDIDYEFRKIYDYEPFTVYPDQTRIRISNVHKTYSDLTLIDSLLEEKVLVKISNTCLSETKTKYVSDYYPDFQPVTTQIPNSGYSESCGLINSLEGITKTDKIINYYNTIYSSSGTTNIDYSTVNASDYLDNIDFFDNYLIENINRDFRIDDRNPTLIRWVLSYLKYELFKSINSQQIPVNVQTDHDFTFVEIKDATKGVMSLNLKKYEGSKVLNSNSSFHWGKSIEAFKFSR